MKSYALTDVGMKRSMNQDYMYCNESAVGSFHNLFIVADGMGGHKAGDYASKLCVEEVVKSVEETKHTTPVSIFEEAIGKANNSIFEKASKNENYYGMGTTMVACTIENNIMYVANIGDSRLYLYNGDLKQITDDHSLVEELVKKGNITESEARLHPQKNIITRALGTEDDVCADFFEVPVCEGDCILMCSDGLSNMIDEDDMVYILSKSESVLDAGKTLVEQANRNGGNDNITVILIKIQ